MLSVSHLFDQALQHHRVGQLHQAELLYRQILQTDPLHFDALHMLGVIANQVGQNDLAVAYIQQVLRMKPDFSRAYNNLGNALRDQGKLDEAVASYRQALHLKPDHAEAHNNLGCALRDQGKVEEAITHCQQAVRLKPDYADAKNNLGTLLLLIGDFIHGWKEYEWRWQTRSMIPGLRHFAQPLWQGNFLPHGTILLHAEQGLGDTIQFIRFAALVKERVGSVLCECHPELARLLQSYAGIDRIIPFGEQLPAFDVHAPLMSLPGILETTLETIPAVIPYLYAGPALTETQARAFPGSTDFKVGVVWQGNPRTWNGGLKRADRLRSVPLAQFEPLARVPGVRLISLQKGFGTEQLQDLAGRFPIADLGSTCADVADTAAVMKNLDLIVSVDSSPAHLAGALGVPVWVPLPSVCCWRWLMRREDSPWYPTMRLFRQKSQGDWADVFDRMARELESLMRPET